MYVVCVSVYGVSVYGVCLWLCVMCDVYVCGVCYNVLVCIGVDSVFIVNGVY